jgi:hypothetical protein
MRSLPGKIAGKTWEHFYSDDVSENLLDYRFGDRIAEEKAFWLAQATRARVVHVLYGDEQLNILLDSEERRVGKECQ